MRRPARQLKLAPRRRRAMVDRVVELAGEAVVVAQAAGLAAVALQEEDAAVARQPRSAA